ncbi:MAG: secretin N-terminal domain-containing protein [Verrucomicrobiota bacterium]
MKPPVLLFLILLLAVRSESPGQGAAPSAESQVTLQFPNNPVSDVANFYELLTKKRLIRDSNLAGPNLTIMMPETTTRAEAISLIESALLLNGYTLVPVDATTSKLLGPTKQPKNESIPLYGSAAELPVHEQVVSFFMPFRYLASEEAAKIFNSYVALRPYGSLVPAPNVNALIITENVPLIRRLIALQKVIDVPGARSATEFFSLQRADAEKVTEILEMIFSRKEGAGAAQAAATANGEAQAAPLAGPFAVKIAADTRTNRVMVIAPEQEIPYIRQLITNLDVSVPFEEPFERPLRFVSAGEVLPVLANLLADGQNTTDTPETPGAPASQASVQLFDPSQNSGYSPSSPPGSGGSGKPDRLRDPAQNTAPLSVIVGSARIIADRSSNKIIVIGPPESRAKAGRVLDMLDQRPKQVYLAVVIGQLTLGKGLNAGIQYPGSVTGKMFIAGGNGNGTVNAAAVNTTGVNNGGVDVLPGTTQMMNTAINLVGGSMSGLSIYGIIADSIDVTVNALQSTNQFKVISRPVIYTANNKKAVISSGQQVPIPESSLTSSLAVGSQGTSIASNIEYKDVVLKLEVIPLINSKDEVTLTIAQQNDNVQETVQISDNKVPVIGTQELTTTVTVPNRHTIVLGGLITEEERTIKTGLPLLSDIPGLSYLFGSKEKNIVRRELIIMIQPFIIEDRGQLAEANAIERANSGFTSAELYETPVPVKKAVLPGESTKETPLRTVFPSWQGESPMPKAP